MKSRLAIAAVSIAAFVMGAPASTEEPRRLVLDAAQSAVSARVAFFGLASKTAHFPEVSGGIQLDADRPGAVDLDVTLNARALERSSNSVQRDPRDFDDPVSRAHGSALRSVSKPRLDRNAAAALGSLLLRRRLQYLPLAAVLPDHPE